MIQLFDFQQQAAAQMADRFSRYLQDRPIGGTTRHQIVIPFYQALASITGSGKTAVLAEAVSEMQPLLAPKPIVLWLSKGRVVVSQTYDNLQDGGKYRHLLPDFQVRLLSEYDAVESADEARSFIYFATVGTFNQRDRELGERLIFRSEIDTAERSTWDAIRARETKKKYRRPLMIVYDEGHNLTDQQTELLMELEPDAILVAGATLKPPPPALAGVLDELTSRGWNQDELTTHISPKDVADSGLIKHEILLGGYEVAMQQTISDLLSDMKKAKTAGRRLGLHLRPKAIYVCKTNVKETNRFQIDDPKRPFAQREAPPILIWRYLVEEKRVDPSSIAVYSNLTFDMKRYPPPPDFILFRGGDKDYASFMAHRFEHIIFNLTLQEGWDDPECYFAYIDKSMGSKIQVEQVMGRVLRQPGARHYESEHLNTAHFYVRVDKKGIFTEIVDRVRDSISSEGLEVSFSSYIAGSRSQPRISSPRKDRKVPHIYLDSRATLEPIAKIVNYLTDYRADKVNTVGAGARALVQQKVGGGREAEIKWVPYEHNSTVSARWIVQIEISKQFPRALEVVALDDPRFDALVELGSKADFHLRKIAHEIVDIYLREVRLGQRLHNPYVVDVAKVDPSRLVRFKHSIHPGYSGLNPLELDFARALDNTRYVWCRNPPQSGYGIPLLTRGQSKTFFPDFLVWRSQDVFAIDTTGEHLLKEKTARKLLAIAQDGGKQRIFIRLVSKGAWNENVEPLDRQGFTAWTLRPDRNLGLHHFDSLMRCIKACLQPDQT